MSKLSYTICFCGRRLFKAPTAPKIPRDVKNMFKKYSEDGVMSAESLQRFLFQEQKESSATVEAAQSIIDSLHVDFHRGRGLKLEGFFEYLLSDKNFPISLNLGVHQDMTCPLSHYFIYTGHNSYLTGNQLTSDSSDVPIVQALQRGVRVIELDLWPNSTNDDVKVYHGWTLTTPVKLIKCLRSIKEYAFVASDYPVVVTLEDHLNPILQAKVSEMLTGTFGDMLYLPNNEFLRKLPSPESLKKRVIISTKPPKESLVAKELKDDSHEGKDLGDEEVWGKEVPDLKPQHSENKDNLDDEDNENPVDIRSKSYQLAPEYKHLIAIHAGKPKGHLKEALKGDPNKVRRLSLSEQQLENAIGNHGKDLVRFTQQNMLRIYPKGLRINSSNYNPFFGWTHGAQMVAFNMQGYGRSLWLMQGMFKSNGGCGYVKKPEFLLNKGPNGDVFDPKEKLPVKKRLKITIYMGDGWVKDFSHTHFDAYSPPDFYARAIHMLNMKLLCLAMLLKVVIHSSMVGIAGVAADASMKEKTKTLQDNWTPAWNEVFEFPLTVPELALLRVEVHEYDMPGKDDFGGQTCLPVAEIREGIRAIPLHDREGEKLENVKLLMRFQFV